MWSFKSHLCRTLPTSLYRLCQNIHVRKYLPVPGIPFISVLFSVLRGSCQLCTNSLGEFTNTFVLFAGRCQTNPKGISVEGKHNNFVHILYFILSRPMCKPRCAMSGSSLIRSENLQCLISVLIRFIFIIFDLLEMNFERLLKCQLSAFN